MADSGVDVAGILGFDPFAPEFHADPYAHYRELRAGGPLQRTPAGIWLSTSFEVCAQIFRDPKFAHGDAALGTTERPPRRIRSFLTLDPPEHTRLRRLVSRAFTARLIERLRPRVEAIVDELLAGVDGEVDLISALAHPLPVIVISEMLGVPQEDEERFKAWSDLLARGLDPDFLVPPEDLARRDRAREEFGEYFRELAARRRAAPGEDLLSGAGRHRGTLRGRPALHLRPAARGRPRDDRQPDRERRARAAAGAGPAGLAPRRPGARRARPWRSS